MIPNKYFPAHMNNISEKKLFKNLSKINISGSVYFSDATLV